MKNSKNTFIFTVIAAVIIIVIGVGLSFFLTRNISEKAGPWKTYTDNSNGFSIQYPGDLFSVASTTAFMSADYSFETLSYYVDNINRAYFEFPISDTLASSTGIFSAVSFGASPQSVSTCQELGGGEATADGKLMAPVSTTTINGISFATFRFGQCGGAYCFDITQYSTIHNGMCYKADMDIYGGPPLDLSIPEKIDDANGDRAETMLRSTFVQMISTFKII